MPLPDILPPEIWHNIIEIEEFSVHDKRAMLAVAPLTTAKGMHDAAFCALFQALDIKFFGGSDPFKLVSKLSLYSASDSSQLRSAVHYLHLHIYLVGNSMNTIFALKIENCASYRIYSFVHLLENGITDFLEVICDVLATLPNLTEVKWIDVDPVSSRQERRWNCIRSHLPQLTKLTLRHFEYKYPLDLQTAKALRSLSLHCRFNLSSDGPWIISDAKIRTLSFRLEDYPRLNQPEPSKLPVNIFSRTGLDLSSLATFILDVQSLSSDDLSYLLPSSLSNNGSSLGANLQSLTLLKVDYELALALSNSTPFPSLRSCSLVFPKSQVTSGKFSSSVRHLCVFLSRQTFLEVLVFGVFLLVLVQPDLRAYYDVELCSENFVNALLLLKNLKRLKLMCYDFSLNHPALRISPLVNLESLIIQTSNAILSPANIVAEKLKPYTALRLFVLNTYGDSRPSRPYESNVFASILKKISTRIKFAAVDHAPFWLQNEERDEPDRLHPGHFMYQSYVNLFLDHSNLYIDD